MVGAKHDTMDPKAMEEQSKLVQKGRYLYCPNGSHLAMWDDQQVFMTGVIGFIKDVDAGKIWVKPINAQESGVLIFKATFLYIIASR